MDVKEELKFFRKIKNKIWGGGVVRFGGGGQGGTKN